MIVDYSVIHCAQQLRSLGASQTLSDTSTTTQPTAQRFRDRHCWCVWVRDCVFIRSVGEAVHGNQHVSVSFHFWQCPEIFFGNPVRPISVSILRWEYNVELGDEFLQLLDFCGVQGRPIATHLSITHRAIQPSKNSVLHRRSALSVWLGWPSFPTPR
jgi:hypothetical protein